MSSLDELYKETILDHYRAPRNHGAIAGADIFNHKDNPFCGDEIDLYVNIENGVVTDIRFEGKGCSISQASSSMMTEKLKGLSPERALEVASEFSGMMQGSEPDEDVLGELVSLRGIHKYPVRIKCALLGWDSLKEGLADYDNA